MERKRKGGCGRLPYSRVQGGVRGGGRRNNETKSSPKGVSEKIIYAKSTQPINLSKLTLVRLHVVDKSNGGGGEGMAGGWLVCDRLLTKG